MDIYARVINAATAAAAAADTMLDGWEPDHGTVAAPGKPYRALREVFATKEILTAAIEEFEKFLAADVRNRGNRLELHYHNERKLTPYESLFLHTARSSYSTDGDLEFDDACVVSGSDDDGEYVLCWKWVPNAAVTFPQRHKAHVYYKDSDGVLHHIATDEVIALDQGAAESELLDRHWDSRLDTDCVPHFTWEELETEDFNVTVYNINSEPTCSEYSEFTVSQYQYADVRPAMQVLFPHEDFTIEIEGEYVNKYRCVCGHEWEDQHSCQCNDRCAKCNKEIEPYEAKESDTPQEESEDA